MDLTDEQWALIRPLIPPPSPFARGRPPASPRATLDGIFRKLRLNAPWYNLPPRALDGCPSWQTCYRAYRRWSSTGLLDQVYRRLAGHLLASGALDFPRALWIACPSRGLGPRRILAAPAGAAPGVINQSSLGSGPASGDLTRDQSSPVILIILTDTSWDVQLSPVLENTWQGSTALLLTRHLISRVRSELNLAP